MAKQNKVKVSDIEKATENRFPSEKVFTIPNGESSVSITVKTSLTLNERFSFVNDIIDLLFLEDEEGELSYNVASRVYAIQYNVVKYFTNIQLPTSLEKAYNFLEKTRIYDDVMDNIFPDYIEELLRCVDEAISFAKSRIIHRSKYSKIVDKIFDVINTIGEKVENIDPEELLKFVNDNEPELKEQLTKFISEKNKENED